MNIPISLIHVPTEDRIRERKNIPEQVSRRSASIIRYGQLQPILVKQHEGDNGKLWELVDGEIRVLTLMALSYRHAQGEPAVVEAFTRWGMTPGVVEATTRETIPPDMALMMEYAANEDKDNFDWDEKAGYIRRIHDMCIEKHGRKDWTADNTAEYIGQSPATVSHYLQLTDTRNLSTQSERVKTAKTKGAALKQLKIETNKRIRTERAQAAEVSKPKIDERDYNAAASLSVFNGDCRQWIKRIPNESLDWFHWDPPYGGKEGAGGAFTSHKGISEDHNYMMELTLQMLPEIWRVLHDGAWMAIWYTPVHYNWLRLALQGHRFHSDTGNCHHCDKHILKDHAWLSENYSCRRSPYRFWVNPFPCIWRKTGRKADGHEIQRFLLKETEPFLLCGKQDKQTPILLRSDRGNVFDFEPLAQHSEDRRHVHHKTVPLLSEILSIISVPGGLGGDAGAGSGSIIEATSAAGRKIVVAEIEPEFHTECLNVGLNTYKQKNYGPESIASWLKEAFADKP